MVSTSFNQFQPKFFLTTRRLSWPCFDLFTFTLDVIKPTPMMINDENMLQEDEEEFAVADEENFDVESSSESDASDSTIGYNDSDSDIDVSNSSYHIATQPITQHVDLSTIDEKAWQKVTEPEQGHRNVLFDDSLTGLKRVSNCEHPIDFLI